MGTAAGAAVDGNALLIAAGAGRDRYLARLAALVAADSGTADVPGVNRVARLVAGYARESGLEPEEHPLPDGRIAVVARRRGTGRARIVLAGHLDTVFPAGTAAERPFRVDEALGRAHGPGVCDDKGGLLAGIAAVETLAALGAERYGEIVLVCSPVGVPVRDAATGGGADANLIAALGVPVLDGLGPVGGCDHAPGEWLDLASVVPRTALLAALIDRVAGT